MVLCFVLSVCDFYCVTLWWLGSCGGVCVGRFVCFWVLVLLVDAVWLLGGFVYYLVGWLCVCLRGVWFGLVGWVVLLAWPSDCGFSGLVIDLVVFEFGLM